MTITAMAETPTFLIVGGYTEPWLESIDHIHQQAGSCAWLRRFLDDVTAVVKAETRYMHPAIRNSLGPSGIFTNIQEVADLYREHDDHVGFVQCIMSYIVRAVILLRYDERCPRQILRSLNQSQTADLGYFHSIDGSTTHQES